MSGILDNKSRIIDAIITDEGRRQMAEGTFKIAYATFTDADVAYVPDLIDGHEDPTGRIYFEAMNLPQDQIVFEANDEGKLVPFRKQDIKVKFDNDFSLQGETQASMNNGNLSAFSYHHGRSIKVSSITRNMEDLNKGFVYCDGTGANTASILINPNLQSGKVFVSSSAGGPYTAYIGTKDGLGYIDFSNAIVDAFGQISASSPGSPKVVAKRNADWIFVDVGNTSSIDPKKTIFNFTGSSPSGVFDSLRLDLPALGGKVYENEIENASFASQIKGILTSSFDNFSKLRTISTIDRLFEDENFELSVKSKNTDWDCELNYYLTNIKSDLFDAMANSPPTLNTIDSLFSDNKLSNLKNYKYLPPIKKTSDSRIANKSNVKSIPSDVFLGDYPSWGDNENELTLKKLLVEINGYESKEVVFTKSSLKNNVIGQIFEVSGKDVQKLDIIDYGKIINDSMDPRFENEANVFFVGKTYLDNRGTTCYVNMFTLFFSEKPKEFEE